MVQVHADGALGPKEDLVDLSAFKGITNKREPSERSPSNSAATIHRIARRYERDQPIYIFEDGKELSGKSPCVLLDLNQMLKKYYVR